MGKIEVKVTTEPMDFSLMGNCSSEEQHGAANIFLGYVRALNMGREVIGIQYDCFIPLCEKVFREISLEAQEQWGKDTNILIIHRYGYLRVGEISVAIMVTTRHRDESYHISRYIIEEIKTRAPIWKKEYYNDGEMNWSPGHVLGQHKEMGYS